jgi:hypothetical protein
MFSTRRASRTGGLVVLAVFLALAGLSASQDQGAAVTLAYQFPEGKTLSYRAASIEKQDMQVNGQDINTNTESSLEFTAKPKSSKDGVHGITVTIDAMKIRVQSPQGDQSPALDHVPGKSFDMSLTRLGKETDTSGAAAISYVLGTSSRDLSSRFQAFFPDLPDRPIKQGDTWPSQDAVTEKTGGGDIVISLTHVNTLDGFETVDGVECARIKTESKGTLKGNLEEGGASLTLDGTMTASATWYFAIKQGFLVKSDSKGGFSGSLAVAQANMIIPVTGESTEEVRLVRK